jgi:MFS family permease
MRGIRVYRYRWVVLVALMSVVMASEMQWLALAPISRVVASYYNLNTTSNSFVGPDLLTLIHLVAFVVVSIPISWVVTKVSLKWTLRYSAIALAFFSFLKGFGAHSFWIIVFAQVGLSISYSAIMNNVTLVVSRWFPLRERGFATGLVSLSQYLGLALVLIIAPLSVVTDPNSPSYGQGIESLLLWLGIFNGVASIIVLFFFKEKPLTPPSKEPFKLQSYVVSFNLLLRKKHMGGFIGVFSLVWALYNIFIIKIDTLSAFIGIETSAGVLGIVFLIGGALGSLLIPLASDYFKKRKLFFVICMLGIFGGVLLFAFIPLIIVSRYNHILLAHLGLFILGFFFQSAIPLGFQYASELSSPVQESSSHGVLLMGGHLLAIPFLMYINYMGGAYVEHLLILSVGLLFASLLGVLFIKESPIIITEEQRLQDAIARESIRLN